MVEPQIAQQLQERIKDIESGTDLKRVAVLSRAGMKIATAGSSTMDADAETGSSAALIELSEKLSDSVNHGELREIVVKAEDGFVILQHINPEFMVFGGISNPLRVGFYLEYLRNEANKFAYILAGNQVTDELKKEIKAQKERAKKEEKKDIDELTKDFAMDKSADDDIKAMEGVLGFLQDWSSEEGEEPAAESQGDVVGLDQDMTFGLEGGGASLAPTSISQEDIEKARGVSTEDEEVSGGKQLPAEEEEDIGDALDALEAIAESAETTEESSSETTGENIEPPEPAEAKAESAEPEITPPEPSSQSIQSEEDAMNDALSALDSFTGRGASEKASTQAAKGEVVEEDEMGLPDEILDSLDEIAEGGSTAKKAEPEEDLPYGIKIYEGEVPPVPLEDYVSFEVGSLTESERKAQQEEAKETRKETKQPEKEIKSPPQEIEEFEQDEGLGMESEYGDMGDIPMGEDGEPDFDAMVASEYIDPDLELEEDALVDALNEIEQEKEKKNE